MISAHLAYLRPRTFVPTFVLGATGWAASQRHGQSALEIATQLAWLFVVYSILLWGGANAFNSAQDRDEGPVNLLPNPPPRPATLGIFGIALSALAVPAAALMGWRAAIIVLACFVLSIFYSWRTAGWRRGKEIGIADNAINALGCGLFAILLGHASTGAPLDARILGIGAAFTIAVFGGYPTTQIFQLRPGERYAEARNFTSLLGPARALRVGAVCFVLHCAILLAIPGSTSTLAWVLRAGWLLATLGSAVHSWGWARHPFDRPYVRMGRQMAAMLIGQALWAASQLT